MGTNSNQVSQAMRSISTASQQNSTALYQASANTRAIDAQVIEVLASAQSLTEMAQNLSLIVAQFKWEAVD
jgi:methyl-accepting chemotaxis protein